MVAEPNGKVQTPLAKGFERMLGPEVDYSNSKYQVKQDPDGHYPPEANCRLTAFLMLRGFVQTNGKKDDSDTYLMFDLEAVDTEEQFKMAKEDRKNFNSLYNWIPVQGLTTVKQHTKAIKDTWKDREIVIDSSTGVSLLNVYIHATFEDVRMVGHTGVLYETDRKSVV